MTPVDKASMSEAGGTGVYPDRESLRKALEEGMRIAEERFPNTLRLLEDA